LHRWILPVKSTAAATDNWLIWNSRNRYYFNMHCNVQQLGSIATKCVCLFFYKNNISKKKSDKSDVPSISCIQHDSDWLLMTHTWL